MKFVEKIKWNIYFINAHIKIPILVIYTTKINFDTKYPNNIFYANHFYCKGIQT